MAGFDYNEYVQAFNSGDDAALIERYFVPEFKYTGGARRFESRDEFLAFLKWAHDGVREIIRPITVLQDSESIFAEIDMDFIALKQRDDFPFAKLAVGDILTVKFFVLYALKDGLVTSLKSMTWPADYQATKAPRLGAHIGQRAAFVAYTKAFSAGDGERMGRYYTDDVVLKLPTGPTLNGRQAIVDFYATMFERVRETLDIKHLVTDDNGISCELISTFTAHEDAPDFQVLPLKKGQVVQVPVFVHYTLQDGLIKDIRVARSASPAYV